MFMVDGIALVFTAQFYMVVFRWYGAFIRKYTFQVFAGTKKVAVITRSSYCKRGHMAGFTIPVM